MNGHKIVGWAVVLLAIGALCFGGIALMGLLPGADNPTTHHTNTRHRR